MASNASTDSLSEVSDLGTDTECGIPFDAGMLYDKCSNEWLVTHYITYAEDASDEVASFFQVMTMSTTRRLPAKNANVLEGICTQFGHFPLENFLLLPCFSAPYVYETVKKSTRTLISHSLTPPAQMLIKSRYVSRSSLHGPFVKFSCLTPSDWVVRPRIERPHAKRLTLPPCRLRHRQEHAFPRHHLPQLIPDLDTARRSRYSPTRSRAGHDIPISLPAIWTAARRPLLPHLPRIKLQLTDKRRRPSLPSISNLCHLLIPGTPHSRRPAIRLL